MPHVYCCGIDERQILFHICAVVLGDYHVGTLAQPGVNLVLRTNDQELHWIPSQGELEETYPTIAVSVAFGVRRVSSDLNGNGNIGTDMSLDESSRPCSRWRS